MCDRKKPTIVRFSAADADQGYPIPGGPWQAIAIGPESDYDRCTIVAGGSGVPVPTAGGVEGSVDRQVDIASHAFALSVERPWIGPVDGPLNVLMPYAKSLVLEAGPTTSRLKANASTPLWQQFTGRPDFGARVELVLYPFLPPWLPTKRAPMEFAFNYPNFGTTGETSLTLIVPGYGRRSLSLSLGMLGLTAGSLSWNFKGANEAENDAGSPVISTTHTLQAATTEVANFGRTYAFDGEFDVYMLQLAELAALNAGVSVYGFIKAWD